VLAALAVVGDFWTLGVIRSVFNGFSRFGEIQRELGIATNVLTDRLGRLVDAGVLKRVPYGRQAARHEYELTAAGRELGLVLVALNSWGHRYVQTDGPRTVWHHAGCASPATVQVRCPDCGAALELSDMEPASVHEHPENP
jgi:DNA-binding HxlR family transcriptional regulator